MRSATTAMKRVLSLAGVSPCRGEPDDVGFVAGAPVERADGSCRVSGEDAAASRGSGIPTACQTTTKASAATFPAAMSAWVVRADKEGKRRRFAWVMGAVPVLTQH